MLVLWQDLKDYKHCKNHSHSYPMVENENVPEIMTYIIVKTFAQVRYVIWYTIFMGIIQAIQKPLLIPSVNFHKKAFNVIF